MFLIKKSIIKPKKIDKGLEKYLIQIPYNTSTTTKSRKNNNIANQSVLSCSFIGVSCSVTLLSTTPKLYVNPSVSKYNCNKVISVLW